MNAAKGAFLNSIFIFLLFAIGTLPWYGLFSLSKFITNIQDFIFEIFVCICLFLLGSFGVRQFIKSLIEYSRNTYKQDVIGERFSIVDVTVVEWRRNSDMETSESLVTVKDINGNKIDKEFTTINWIEISKTNKGVIVVFENNNIPGGVFPVYDENNKFCKKCVNIYNRRK